MKFHDLIQMREKICDAMIAGIKMICVPDRFRLKLAVQGFGSVFESVFVVASAIEINREVLQASVILSGKRERVVLLPVGEVDGVAKYRAQESSEGILRMTGLRDHCRALRAD